MKKKLLISLIVSLGINGVLFIINLISAFLTEKVLLGIALLGGAFGSYPAMLIFRHKTKGEHWYFTFCNLLGLIIHITAIVLILLLVK